MRLIESSLILVIILKVHLINYNAISEAHVSVHDTIFSNNVEKALSKIFIYFIYKTLNIFI